MTIVGFFTWILGTAIPFFMNQNNVSCIVFVFGWLFPAVGCAIDDWKI